MRIEVTDLGTWAPAALLAEYDPSDDTIRIDVRAVDAVRAALGAAEAENFITVAIAHERFHREHPTATEARARAYVEARFGAAPERFEAAIRAALGRRA